MRVCAQSGCCLWAYLGISAEAKKENPRGLYYGCTTCGRWVERAEAAYQFRLMRRTVKEMGLRLVRRHRDS